MNDVLEALPATRLRWACRRGMLELDILLGDFLDKGYDALSDEEKMDFQRLLKFPDQEIFEFCMNQAQPEEPQLKHVVEKIRRAAAA